MSLQGKEVKERTMVSLQRLSEVFEKSFGSHQAPPLHRMPLAQCKIIHSFGKQTVVRNATFLLNARPAGVGDRNWMDE